ncbi:MAG: MoaD/ThiS family protein [Desulfobacterales bacterium]|nr:MoaD/ThiS family protein [Deltaproteobacteria bacterium]NNK95110.1 MoaD/ThiS family protein [Desulfobacterales bacterium]
MGITVQLFTYFRDNRFSSQKMYFPEGIMVVDVINTLGIDHDEIGVILVNAKHCQIETLLSDEDTLSLFPLISGG